MNDSDPFTVLEQAPDILAPVAVAYDKRLGQWGARARGVFWRNEEGQRLRFEVLSRALQDEPGPVTINDLGCGYGAFFDFLKDHPALRGGRFHGYDISEAMIRKAQERIDDPRATFTQGLIANEIADYSFASGTYNLCLDTDVDRWIRYVKASLTHLWTMTRKVVAFNMLAGLNYKRDGLYYAEAKGYLAFCRTLSPDVTFIDDYPLKEWTIVVRR
jgi:SAM-dependent methyltransferase